VEEIGLQIYCDTISSREDGNQMLILTFSAHDW